MGGRGQLQDAPFGTSGLPLKTSGPFSTDLTVRATARGILGSGLQVARRPTRSGRRRDEIGDARPRGSRRQGDRASESQQRQVCVALVRTLAWR